MMVDDFPLASGNAVSLIGRRRFLKRTFTGFIALNSAKLIPVAFGQVSSQDVPRLKYFSEHEYRIIRAVAARMTGDFSDGNTGQSGIDAAARADIFLSTADPEVQEQIHLLVTIFNSRIFTFLFDFRFSSFLDMRPDEQDAHIADWMTSALEFRRTGFQALKRLSMSMYYTDPRSWNAIGFEGMFQPGERP